MLAHLPNVVLLALFGAFGGLIYGVRETGLVLPHRAVANHSVRLGFLADVMFGIAGAFVVFLLIPADINADEIETVVKVIGLAVLGGYAGPALLDKLVSETLRDVQREQEQFRRDLSQQRGDLETALTERQRDQNALALVDRYLNDSEAEEISPEDLLDAIDDASQRARYRIYEIARETRRKTWSCDKPALERTIPVFEALLESGISDGETHRLCAPLAYALKDKRCPDYVRALELLDRAIELRREAGLAASAWYHFNRAFCLIAMRSDSSDHAFSAVEINRIRSDLANAEAHPSMKQAVENCDLIKTWTAAHPAEKASVEILSTVPSGT
jgi:tetratricopeptide (TPR) repeat protein